MPIFSRSVSGNAETERLFVFPPLHTSPPSINLPAGKKTIAFQVSEELYQRIKDYLKHYEETYGRKLSQKDFMVQLIEAELDAVDEEAEAAAAQKQDPSAEMNDTVGEDPAEDPAESDDEDEPDVDQENNDPDEDSDTDEETNTEEAPDEATDGESEYGESGDAYTEE